MKILTQIKSAATTTCYPAAQNLKANPRPRNPRWFFVQKSNLHEMQNVNIHERSQNLRKPHLLKAFSSTFGSYGG